MSLVFRRNRGTKFAITESVFRSLLMFFHDEDIVMRSLCARLLTFLLVVFALTACAKDKRKMDSALAGESRWATFPVPLRVDEFLLDDGMAQDDLRAAIEFWENRAGRQLFTTGTWRSGAAPYNGNPADPSEILENVIFFQNPWPFEERIAGKTILFSQDGLIQKAAVFLNTTTSLCSGYCIDEPGRTSRRKLLAHELGHFLGFPHTEERNNIMFPEILPGGALDGLSVDAQLLKKLTQ